MFYALKKITGLTRRTLTPCEISAPFTQSVWHLLANLGVGLMAPEWQEGTMG